MDSLPTALLTRAGSLKFTLIFCYNPFDVKERISKGCVSTYAACFRVGHPNQ